MAASTTRKRAARKLKADHAVGYQAALAAVDAVLASPGWVPNGRLVELAALRLPTSHHTDGVTPMTDVNTHLTDRTQLADHLMRQHGVEPATLATLDTGHLRGSHQFEHDEFGPLDHDHRTGAVRSAATARAARQQLRNALVEQLNSDVYDAAWDAHVDDDLVFDPGDLTGFQLAVSFERDSAGNEYLEAQLDALLIGLIDLVPIRSSGLDGTALSFTGQAGEALTLLCRDGLIDQPGRWTIILHGDGDDQHRLVHHTDDGTDRYPMPVDLPCCGHTSASPAETDEHLPGCQY